MENKKIHNGLWYLFRLSLFFFVSIWLIVAVLYTIQTENAKKQVLQAEKQSEAFLVNQAAKAFIQAKNQTTDQTMEHFSAWDGSHRGLTKIIKRAMNDPSSYKHIETLVVDKGSYLIVKTTYRGKNGFNAIVKGFISAMVDLNGNVIQILAQG